MSAISDKISFALHRFGHAMTLRRETLGPGGKTIPLDVTVYGTTDGAIISKLIGSVVQTGMHVVFSNAEIADAQWPGPPKTGDKLIDGGTMRTLGSVEIKDLASEILVFACEMTG